MNQSSQRRNSNMKLHTNSIIIQNLVWLSLMWGNVTNIAISSSDIYRRFKNYDHITNFSFDYYIWTKIDLIKKFFLIEKVQTLIKLCQIIMCVSQKQTNFWSQKHQINALFLFDFLFHVMLAKTFISLNEPSSNSV